MIPDELITQCRQYYKKHPSGGSLHIALDDGNMETDHVQFCLDYAMKERDRAGVKLARTLLELSLEQREELYERLWEVS